jgi:uncharacterized repeat protein (TIGR01451 family)
MKSSEAAMLSRARLDGSARPAPRSGPRLRRGERPGAFRRRWLSVALVLSVGCIGVALAGPATALAQDSDCGVPVAVPIENAGFEDPPRPPGAAPVTELPGWTVSGNVRHSGPDLTFSSLSQSVHLGDPDGSGEIEQLLDGAALRGQTVTFQVVSVRAGTLALGGQSALLLGDGFEEATHTVSFDVPADATDVLPLRLSSGDTWAIDSVSASYTPPCPASTDVRVSLSGPASAPRGSFVTYTLEVTNSGQAAATDVTSVIAAAGLSIVTTSPQTGTGSVTIAGDRLSGALWRTPTLAPGAQATFTLRGKVAVAAGKYVAVAGGALAANPPDSRLGNNIAFAATRSR